MAKIPDFLKELKSFCKSTYGRKCFTAKGIILLNGDCNEIVYTLANEFGQIADCWINDPPYGTTLNDWDNVIPHDDYWDMARAITKDTAPMIVFGSQPFTSAMVMSAYRWFRYCLVWDKNKCGSPGLAKYRPMKVHEDIMVFSRATHPYYPQMEEGNPYYRVQRGRTGPNNHKYGFNCNRVIDNSGTRYPKSILRFPRNFSAQQQIHPTQKPDTLLEWLLRSYTRKHEVVIDITSGSGSLAAAAFRAKRICICIEKERKYFKAGVAWIKALHRNVPWRPAEYRKKFLEARE